jgi:hypothetical protein
MTRRPFDKYKNKVLVESGTFMGDGVQYALDCGFNKVISYEIDNKLYYDATNRFKGNKKVELHHKSSAKMFNDIKDINVPITFWLDGHYSAGNTGYDDECAYPLLKELEIISQHHIKSHTILIDDRRLLKSTLNLKYSDIKNTSEMNAETIGYSEEQIIEKIKNINSDYKISYEDGHIKNDIIVATI